MKRYRRTLGKLTAIGGLLSIHSCANATGPTSDRAENQKLEIPSTPLSGFIGGKPWLAARAIGRPELSAEGTIFVEAYDDESVEPCADDGVHPPSLLLSVPRLRGNYPFSQTINATFLLDDESQTNLSTGKGRVHVLAVENTNMEIGVTAQFDQDNGVSGRVTVDVCLEQ